MREALEPTYNVTSESKQVIAIGNPSFDPGCFAGGYTATLGESPRSAPTNAAAVPP
jgi:Ni,Fe-hydrogenase III small subunit